MTYSEIVEMLRESSLPFSYDHFAEGESPDPPFLIFRFPTNDNFHADGKVYQKIAELDIELYTDLKNPPLEETIEGILEENGIIWSKTEAWLESEKLYEVLYEMEVLYASES